MSIRGAFAAATLRVGVSPDAPALDPRTELLY